jgi:hypothetical protein
MQVKMFKPGGKTISLINKDEVDAYLKRGWSLAVKKTEKKVRKKKVKVVKEPIIVEEPIIVSEPILELQDEQLHLDLNEEQD